MSKDKQLTLPITGMTCANCVAAVERNIKKVDGVQDATVNLSSERATVTYNPDIARLSSIINRIQRAGYDVAEGELDIVLQRLSDSNDAQRLEKVLNNIDGVQGAEVNYGAGRVRLHYVPTLISQSEIHNVIVSEGFEAVDLGGDIEDAERIAREKEIKEQRHYLIVGLYR